ncbi:UNVERIFIED_CONTAM: Benzyl alcohol O-benzoyltransferase [Sesamum calycinum]|uniref:Benzyl alcohol O-benzoyltransferase n=1 Tax=Sesamum calycinum TaxID=2727403 RepID=A0AAW2KW12_9LAMI
MVLDFLDSDPPWLNSLAALKSLLSYQFGKDTSSARVTRRMCHTCTMSMKTYLIPRKLSSHLTIWFSAASSLGQARSPPFRRHLPLHLRRCTTFELLAACIWRCRTIAISPDPNEEVRIICFVNGRRLFNPPLPTGYYGNVVASPLAISTAESLCKQPLHFALELVMKAKSKVTEDYIKSVANLMVIKGRPHFAADVRTYIVSDVTHLGSDSLDYGWGTPVFGGPAKSGVGVIPGLLSFNIPFTNNKGEKGKLVPICLPENAMEVFAKELETMVKRDDEIDLGDAQKSSIFIGHTRL